MFSGNFQSVCVCSCIPFEPRHEKTNNLVSEQVLHKPTSTEDRGCLETGNFGFRKWRNCTIRESKALISFAVTDLRLCFRLANYWFAHDATRLLQNLNLICFLLHVIIYCISLPSIYALNEYL